MYVKKVVKEVSNSTSIATEIVLDIVLREYAHGINDGCKAVNNFRIKDFYFFKNYK